jgi:SAM-dependent methyltransferase
MSTTAMASPEARFRAEYGAHRASEGRGHHGAELLALPYLATGPLARQWGVRARSFDAFLRHVIRPAAAEADRPLDVLDLGAGSGWLCRRLADAGHYAVAVDVRDDTVDGLGAADELLRAGARFHRAAASFDALPLPSASFDVAVFNASLHYALDLAAVLAEAARTLRSGGRLVVLDSPFYARDADGAAMVAEKQAHAAERFGGRADALLSLPFIEYLTADRLARASADSALRWRRHRVRYPLWYELRPLAARLRGRRAPSRFDLWVSTVR